MDRALMKNKCGIVSNGIFASNPIFRLVLGMCPTLAITTSAFNGLGMGLAATLVLVCSNALISLIRKAIPDKVRIPAFVLIIATFVTMIQMLLKKFVPSLFDALGIFLPLIVVNCVILSRAEAFASTHKVGDSILDGLGMGLGFTLALVAIGFVRELIGAGTVFVGALGDTEFGFALGELPNFAMNIFVLPAGGFLTLGLFMAAINAIINAKEKKKKLQLKSDVAKIDKAKARLDIDNAKAKNDVNNATAKLDSDNATAKNDVNNATAKLDSDNATANLSVDKSKAKLNIDKPKAKIDKDINQGEVTAK